MVEIVDQFKAYGPLGVVCALQFLALIALYRAKEAQAERHRSEMTTLLERHIAKAENWVDKGNALAEGLEKVLPLLEARLKPRRER